MLQLKIKLEISISSLPPMALSFQKSSPHGLLHMMSLGFQRVAGRGKPQCSVCLHLIHNGLLHKTNGKVKPRFKDVEIDSTFGWEEAQSHIKRGKQRSENLWLFCKALCKYCHFVNNLPSCFSPFPFPSFFHLPCPPSFFCFWVLFLKLRARRLPYLV